VVALPDTASQECLHATNISNHMTDRNSITWVFSCNDASSSSWSTLTFKFTLSTHCDLSLGRNYNTADFVKCLSACSLTSQCLLPPMYGITAERGLTAVNLNDFPASPTCESLKESLVASVSKVESALIDAKL